MRWTTDVTSVEQIVGTGPFKMKRFVPSQLAVLEANPDYHGGRPKLAGIERPVVLDAVTRLN